MLKIKQATLSKSKYSIKAPYAMTPIGITIHETDNNATAANEIAYMQSNDNQTSFHFAVDEKEIVQGLPLDRNGWHAGDGAKGPGNRTTIAIEICRNYRTDDMTNYNKARKNAEELVGYLLAKYGWDSRNIYTHNDWSGKNCPRNIIKEGYLNTFKANAMKYKGGETSEEFIEGKSRATAKELTDFVKTQNKDFDGKIAEAFISVGNTYGIRGDIALAQSVLETGWFKFAGSAVTSDQHNYCGMGVTSTGMKGASFASIKEGVTAQIQHLYAYANKKVLPKGEVLVDPRFKLVTRGIAPTWIALNGRWATGANYGQKILSIYDDMKISGTPSKPRPSKPKPVVPKKSVGTVAQEIVSGTGGWGNNPQRKSKLEAAGYNYNDVKNAVDKLMAGSRPKPVAPKKSAAQVAKEIFTGKGGWGNNPQRQQKIEAYGLSYVAVQKEVDKLMNKKPSAPVKPKKTAVQVATEIVRGTGGWGNNPGRRQKIKKAGLNYDAVQREVDKLMNKTSKPVAPKKSVATVANEIFRGTGGWGNNPGRKKKLIAAGYNYDEVQRAVTRLMK